MRREVALKVGATLALDPNTEGNGLVAKIKDLCKTDRKFTGGSFGRGAGPDLAVITFS